MLHCGIEYLSTSCLHGDEVVEKGMTGHEYCQNETGKCGDKIPGQCKWCGSLCICPCHRENEKSPDQIA